MTPSTPRVNPPFTYQMPPPQPRTARPSLPAQASAAMPRWMLLVVPEDASVAPDQAGESGTADAG